MITKARIKERLMHYSWDLAYGEFSPSIINQGFDFKSLHIIQNPYFSKWFADPFILQEDQSELHLLVEEYDKSVKRGRIARIVIDKSTDKIVDCKIVLSLSSHLSFPAIYHLNGEIFVHPENSVSGKSYIYKYDIKADKLANPILLVDAPLTDAVIQRKGDDFYLYSTILPDPNGKTLLEFHASNFLGPYHFMRTQRFSSYQARMAGHFIDMGDYAIRPAQDCNGGYGTAVVLMNENREEVRLSPSSWKYAGLHTFNTNGHLYVVDLKRYDNPLLYRLIHRFKQ